MPAINIGEFIVSKFLGLGHDLGILRGFHQASRSRVQNRMIVRENSPIAINYYYRYCSKTSNPLLTSPPQVCRGRG